jgi:hypothetical protein
VRDIIQNPAPNVTATIKNTERTLNLINNPNQSKILV